MTDFIIHGIPGSPFMRAVQIALEEKHAPYRIRPLSPKTLREDDYRKLHPFARVPAIEHGDFRLYETQAILRYIDAVFPEPPLQPQSAEAIGRMNQVMGINDWYLFPNVARIVVFERIVAPFLFGKAPDEQAIAAALPAGKMCVDELNRLLGDGAYFAGAEFSLADILLVPQLYYLAATPEGSALIDGTPLAAWLERVCARPSLVASLPPEGLRRAA